MILDGKAISNSIKEDIKKKSSLFFGRFNKRPCLAVVLVGNDPANSVYVNAKEKACNEVGFDCLNIKLDETVTQSELISIISDLNKNDDVSGILVQLHLPENIDEHAVLSTIMPQKDVDGFTPFNMGNLLFGNSTVVPCTPKGIVRLLDSYDISVSGKNVCVVGRSNIVGKPLATLLTQKDRNATVTLCNSYTRNLAACAETADILICAVGQPNLITADMVKDGAVVVDVGINRIEDSSKKSGYRLCGDTDFNGLVDKCSYITPVPGGVGPMTIAMLMENTLSCACAVKNIEVSDL